MTDLRELYISVDIEADGPIPGDYSMVSLGAVVVGSDEEGFYGEMRPLYGASWVPEALAVSGFSHDQVMNFAQPHIVMENFAAWLDRLQAQSSTRLVMVGFNAPFDWMFVHWYMMHFVGRNPLGISSLDIKAFYMGRTGCTWAETSMARLPDWLTPEKGLSHNAIEDARDQAKIFQGVLTLP